LEQTSEWTATKITGTKIRAMANQANAALALPNSRRLADLIG
jgi:hypothetical protein